MTSPVLARRRRERATALEVARSWAGDLAERLAVEAVVVVGSYARGDFNKWSDIDVLVVAPRLPGSGRERLALLHDGAPPGLQPVGWTPAELEARRRRSDPMVDEADRVGVVVHGTWLGPAVDVGAR